MKRDKDKKYKPPRLTRPFKHGSPRSNLALHELEALWQHKEQSQQYCLDIIRCAKEIIKVQNEYAHPSGPLMAYQCMFWALNGLIDNYKQKPPTYLRDLEHYAEKMLSYMDKLEGRDKDADPASPVYVGSLDPGLFVMACCVNHTVCKAVGLNAKN